MASWSDGPRVGGGNGEGVRHTPGVPASDVTLLDVIVCRGLDMACGALALAALISVVNGRAQWAVVMALFACAAYVARESLVRELER